MADITTARKLFDLLVSKDFDLETLDSSGRPAQDPAEAEIFSFDFRAQSGKDYGTVVIMLTNDGDLEVYCADNVGKTMEGKDKNEWFQFLEQLKDFSIRNHRENFSVKNLNHLRYSMQGQAAIKEGLFESWTGRKDVSYNAGPNESRLMIKHKRNLGEDEARFRYVESLFIETAEGERYKLPFKNLTAGKAMLEHVRNGGRPYDIRGQHIAEMVSELTVLSRFRRANHGKLLEGDTATLVEQTNAYYQNLQRNLKSLTSRRGYDTYFESWAPADISEESMVIEGLKHLFVTQSIDQRIEDALPLIARIQQQENAMKEANIFEAWANTLVEGTWQLPDTPEKQTKLIELLSQDLPVGADATNATEQLYDVLGDDVLFDQLEALADKDANADARQVVLNRMQELSEHPNVRKVIDQLQIDDTAAMNPPEATNPADLETTESVMHGDYAEDKLADDGTLGGDASDELIRDIEIKEPNHNMEESVYPEYQDDLTGILKTAGVPAKPRPAPDYELEVDEGKEDSTAQIIKKLLDPVAQGLAGGGKSLSIPLVGEEEKKSSSSILPAVAAGAAGAGLGYMAGKAMSKPSTPKPTTTTSSSGSSSNYGSWENPGQPSPPTATGIDLGISAPAAGSAADIAASAILEKEVDEGELGTAVGAGLGGAVGGLGGAALGGLAGHYLTKDKDDKKVKEGTPGEMMSGALSANPITSVVKGASNTAGKVAGLGDVASKSFQAGKQSMTAENEVDESGATPPASAAEKPGDLWAGAVSLNPITSVIKGASNTAGKIAGVPAVAGKAFDAGKQSMTKESDLDRISDLAGIKKKVADESLLAPLVGAVGGAALGGELASGFGSKFGSEVGGAIGQAAGQEQAGKLGALVGGMKGSSAGAAAGGAAAKTAGQVAGGIAGLAGGAAIDQAKKSNDDTEETSEGWKGQLAGGTVGSLAGGAAGSALGPIGAAIGSAAGGTAGQMIGDKLGGSDEESSPLKGKYGHSGKLKEVAKDTSFLDRLKELSGMKK
jgi:hypothetical protein